MQKREREKRCYSSPFGTRITCSIARGKKAHGVNRTFFLGSSRLLNWKQWSWHWQSVKGTVRHVLGHFSASASRLVRDGRLDPSVRTQRVVPAGRSAQVAAG